MVQSEHNVRSIDGSSVERNNRLTMLSIGPWRRNNSDADESVKLGKDWVCAQCLLQIENENGVIYGIQSAAI